MADKKISQLTAATTPLAGTEVLPIVQGSNTVKVANNDLRPKQIQSNATSGVLQVTGPAAASTRVMTTPNADFTVARTDAGQSFSGNQDLLDGNLVIGTSGKGIDFSATSEGSGTMTSELLADYEEGTWTPSVAASSGTITSYTSSGSYTKVGRQVTVNGTFNITNIGTGSGSVYLGNLPFAMSIAAVCGAAKESAINGLMYSMPYLDSTTFNVRSAANGDAAFNNTVFQFTATYFT